MDELYVVARTVLLDALEALGSHRPSVIVVGAQAIYMRIGEAELAVAPYTTDADLALDPTSLAETPPLERALSKAGFVAKEGDSVGVWMTHRRTASKSEAAFAVDLLVPAAVSPGMGRRAARLPGHAPRAARKVSGIEGVVVDADLLDIGALEDSDSRVLQTRVAGPGALLVAKMHKIKDRTGTSRATDKDALDVLRILRGIETHELRDRIERLSRDQNAAPVAEEALHFFEEAFGHRSGEGIQMMIRAVGALEDPDEIAGSCELLTADLLGALGRL